MIHKELDTFDRVCIVLFIVLGSLLSFLVGKIYTDSKIAALKKPPCPTCGK